MLSSLRFARRIGAQPFTVSLAHFSSDRSGVAGVVKWFDPKKGYGFLVPDDGTPDVFVHYSVVHANGFKSLADGEQVEFDVIESPDGRVKAGNVTGPGGAPVQGAARRIFPGFAGGGFGGGGDSEYSNYGSGGSQDYNNFGNEEEENDNYKDMSTSGCPQGCVLQNLSCDW